MKQRAVVLIACSRRRSRSRSRSYPSAQVPHAPVTTSIPARDAAPRRDRPPPAPRAARRQPNVIVVGPTARSTSTASRSRRAATTSASGERRRARRADARSTRGPLPELHVVRSGDTLWDICFYYFNDPWQWPKVWSYNPQITNPHWIYPGDLVRLLPRGVFVDADREPETRAGRRDPAQPRHRACRRRSKFEVGIKQTAFVEKAELDRLDHDRRRGRREGAARRRRLGLPAAIRRASRPRSASATRSTRPINGEVEGDKVSARTCTCSARSRSSSVKQDKRARGVIIEANQEIERGAKVGPLVKAVQDGAAGAAEGRRAGHDRRDADAAIS